MSSRAAPILRAHRTGSANLTWNFVPDTFGNVKQATDPTGYQLTYVYDAVAQTYRIQTTDSPFLYSSSSVPDLRFGTVAMDTDINGNKTIYNYDGFGRLVTVDGPYDIGAPAGQGTIEFSYSEQGAAVSSLTGGTVTNPFPACAIGAHKDVQHLSPYNPIKTSTFIDGLDRIIQTKKDLDKDGGSGAATEGMSVSGAIAFDARGRIRQQGQPTFSTSTDPTFFVAAAMSNPPTQPMVNPATFAYDILGRSTSVTTPDGAIAGGAVTTTAYSIGAGPDGVRRLMTTVKDPNVNAGGGRPGAERVSFRDARGNIVAVQERNRLSGSTFTTLNTTYAYDPVDELVKVTDAKSKVTTAQYDSVGRMIALTSPDAGLTKYMYATNGNLGAKETPNLRSVTKKIQYQYETNRLKTIVYPTSFPVNYTYGDRTKIGDANGNKAGHVILETSEAGSKDFEYDRLGNVVKQHWHLNSLRDASITYDETVSYNFDSFGRLLKVFMPNPGKEVVSYGYDRGGNVTSVVGVNAVPQTDEPNTPMYMLQVGYSELEQRTKLVYGNGIVESYGYDPLTHRLSQVNASENDPTLQALGKPPRPFEDMHYAYDLSGNITQIRNDTPFDDNDLAFTLPATVSENFTYDDLYQLKTADGVYQERSQQREKYGLSFLYDSIGNITKKTQTNDMQVPNGTGGWNEFYNIRGQSYTATYTYGSSRPHAATEVDELFVGDATTNTRAVRFDADGNQSGWLYQGITDRAVTWNEEDRITRVTLNGVEMARALYDGSGQREVSVQVPQGTPPVPLEPPDPTGFHETASFGGHLTLRNGAFLTRHVFMGDTRIASKMESEDIGPYPTTLYYHDDHLGSTHFMTNDVQDLVSHIQYFPTGELWVDEVDSRYATRMPYLFNGKELDVATGLYYYGARYYDPHLSQWVSTDPILQQYMLGSPNGGVFTTLNLGLYAYTHNSPIDLLDPNGLWSWRAAGRGFVKGAAWGLGGAVVVTALVASGGTLALVGAGALIGAGAESTGVATY